MFQTSGHYPVGLTWYNTRCKIIKIGHKVINYRCFGNFSAQDFLFVLQNSGLEYVHRIRKPDEAVEFWTKTFIYVYNSNAPFESKACIKPSKDD